MFIQLCMGFFSHQINPHSAGTGDRGPGTRQGSEDPSVLESNSVPAPVNLLCDGEDKRYTESQACRSIRQGTECEQRE